jgi:S-methylmethionine-dependent homocysteine/selenocysteine methylase
MVTLLDGGIGYELKLRGVEVPSHLDSIWSAQALMADPEAVVSVHHDYIGAGADVLTINNYSVTPQLLDRVGMADRVEELTHLAVDLAERAAESAGRRPRIAGSLPPLESSYRVDLAAERDDVVASYRRLAAVLAERVDLILCETMASGEEAALAATAASETGLEYWVSFTMQGDRLNTLPSGESLEQAMAALEDLEPAACLVNCCGANFVTDAMPRLAKLTSGPVGGYANAEWVEPVGGHRGPDAEAEDRQRRASSELAPGPYADEARQWLESGATIIGGCCGTRPDHIRALRVLVDG